jgi:cysteine desulfurase
MAGWNLFPDLSYNALAMTHWMYLDNNATTQPLPEVIEAVAEVQRVAYANPSSVHRFGQEVRHRLEVARQEVAEFIGAEPREIVFTSGGTESINLALKGLLAAHPDRRRIITTQVEHSAVLRVAEELEQRGYEVERLPVNAQGAIDETAFSAALSGEPAVVSLMHANNEVGTLYDIARLSHQGAEAGALVHVDAVQSAGKVPIDVTSWAAHAVSLSAHKFHGPKGVGALYVRRRTKLTPQIVGGRQERDRRGGTEATAACVGMGVAARCIGATLDETAARIAAQRDRLEQGILRAIPNARLHGGDRPRICNTSNIGFAGLQAEAMLMLLSDAGICVSSGSACSSGALEPSHVLRAMDVDPASAHGAVRWSLSRFTTDAEIDEVLRVVPGLIERLAGVMR